jgi:hypothetical protein
MNFSKSFNLMNFGLATAFLGFAAVSGASAAPISNSQTFDVSGTFENDSTLSGSLDINTVSGTITSADLTISGITGIFTLANNGGGDYNSHGFWENVNLSDGGDTLVLGLALQNGKDNLIGYTGGALCNDSGNCGFSSGSYSADALSSYYVSSQPKSEDVFIGCSGNTDPALVTGEVSTTPEPGATTLLGAGFTGLGFLFRRRFVKK